MKVICPKSKSEHTAPIMYGYPAPEAWEALERGEIILGGCMVFPHQEDYGCLDCNHRWSLDSLPAMLLRKYVSEYLSKGFVQLIWLVHGCMRSMQMELQENTIIREEIEKHYFLKKNKCRSERQLNCSEDFRR